MKRNKYRRSGENVKKTAKGFITDKAKIPLSVGKKATKIMTNVID